MKTGTGIFFGSVFACSTWLTIAGHDSQSMGVMGLGIGAYMILSTVEGLVKYLENEENSRNA